MLKPGMAMGGQIMKPVMTALLAGSAVAVFTATARADELSVLKAQIEHLDARIAALAAAPPAPAGYQLIAVSDGLRVDTPGLSWTGRESAAYGKSATHIAVLPAAAAPADAMITWSGYARAGLVYENDQRDNDKKKYDWDGSLGRWVPDRAYDGDIGKDEGDFSLKVRAQLRATATAATAVGKVGVDIRLRGNFSGNGAASIYSDVAWGYWAMTPELTVGGGYNNSLGKVNAGLNGDCVCYYTDNSDVSLDPGDVTQLQLFYGAGPFRVAAALEDASHRAGGNNYGSASQLNSGRMGAAGEITYSADGLYAEIAGTWRDDMNFEGNADIRALWQLGAGLRLPVSRIVDISLAAAFGQGPIENTYEGQIVSGSARNNSWWAVSGLASAMLSDTVHGEAGAGYMSRDLDSYVGRRGNYASSGDWSQWTALAGLYYSPVDKLTFGVEGEWVDTAFSDSAFTYDKVRAGTGRKPDHRYDVNLDSTRLTLDFVTVWRF